MINKSEIEPLVSIITPCYNGERFLKDYFESILTQDYSNIEVFFVNDGSNDNTENIAIEYENKFKERNIRYIHSKQKNQGQAAAINSVLPLIKGKYFMWPDSDDILLPDNVSKKVRFLEQHPEYGLVMGQAEQINESRQPLNIIMKRSHDGSYDNMFEDFIDETNVVFCPGIYMARMAHFKKAVPTLQIYTGQGGQNWQMLLPIIYRYVYGYLDEVLYQYRIVENSHSKNMKSNEEWLKRMNQHQEILLNTIERIDMPKEDYKKYKDRIMVKYSRKRMEIYGYMKDKKQVNKELMKIVKYRSLRSKDLRIFLQSKHPKICTCLKKFIKNTY